MRFPGGSYSLPRLPIPIKVKDTNGWVEATSQVSSASGDLRVDMRFAAAETGKCGDATNATIPYKTLFSTM